MISIEKVETLKMAPNESKAFLLGWYRIAEKDGSTIAYAPDRITAQQIADLFNKT